MFLKEWSSDNPRPPPPKKKLAKSPKTFRLKSKMKLELQKIQKFDQIVSPYM